MLVCIIMANGRIVTLDVCIIMANGRIVTPDVCIIMANGCIVTICYVLLWLIGCIVTISKCYKNIEQTCARQMSLLDKKGWSFENFLEKATLFYIEEQTKCLENPIHLGHGFMTAHMICTNVWLISRKKFRLGLEITLCP